GEPSEPDFFRLHLEGGGTRLDDRRLVAREVDDLIAQNLWDEEATEDGIRSALCACGVRELLFGGRAFKAAVDHACDVASEADIAGLHAGGQVVGLRGESLIRSEHADGVGVTFGLNVRVPGMDRSHERVTTLLDPV